MGIKLTKKWASNEVAYGMWVTMGSATPTEIAVLLNLDWIVIDLEHGDLDLYEVMAHLRAVGSTEMTVLVRVPTVERSSIKRVLDMGADGVLVPLVRGQTDVELAMEYSFYPPKGRRGVGGERAAKWGLHMSEYLTTANRNILVIPIIETKEGVESIKDILNIPGLPGIFFGPADLSASYGFLGWWEGPGIAEMILSIRQEAAERKIATGIVGINQPDIHMRRDQGFNMIALGSDVGFMVETMLGRLKEIGQPRTFDHQWF